ncbi:hypothetical protein CsatB_001585 [Cannabis sativa]
MEGPKLKLEHFFSSVAHGSDSYRDSSHGKKQLHFSRVFPFIDQSKFVSSITIWFFHVWDLGRVFCISKKFLVVTWLEFAYVTSWTGCYGLKEALTCDLRSINSNKTIGDRFVLAGIAVGELFKFPWLYFLVLGTSQTVSKWKFCSLLMPFQSWIFDRGRQIQHQHSDCASRTSQNTTLLA